MKKRFGLAVLLSAMTLVYAVAAQAEVTQNVKIPTTITVFVPCANGGAGENVTVSGDLHALLTFTINGNHVSGKVQFQPQGLSGTGDVTGLKYQATGGTKQMFSLNTGETQSFVNNFRFIGQGPGNNFTAHENAHITFNANGDLTAFHDNLTADCK